MSKSIWSVQFASQDHSLGFGVVVLDGNDLAGGDSSFYYTGKCAITGNVASATVNVKQHAPGTSIFGNISSFTLNLTGHVDGDHMTFNGYVAQNPQFTISVVMKKLANIV